MIIVLDAEIRRLKSKGGKASQSLKTTKNEELAPVSDRTARKQAKKDALKRLKTKDTIEIKI